MCLWCSVFGFGPFDQLLLFSALPGRYVSTSQSSIPRKSPEREPNSVEVFVNGRSVLCESGMTVLQACALAGVEIPRYAILCESSTFKMT
ncbi:unnamed protein product [Protopolystoma xenopodis]|uniref:2Fe-2S ferredoxin-type domain-containing protein n=1 Tax=Protopolystoma xenopodis TaxID=117903 RepID=A0A448XEP1_9PLAT|nr:unnamed protein product [Protopolystoma xenopodis]